MTPFSESQGESFCRGKPLIPDPSIWCELTPTEKAVFIALCKRFTYKGIGHELEMAQGTVRTHLNALRKKARAHDTAELIFRMAGLAPPSQIPRKPALVSRETERAA